MIHWRNNSRHEMRTMSGYTMVELMVVCMIIGILASMSFALLGRIRMQVLEVNAMNALNALATGYEMYYYHNREYPQWGPNEQFDSPKAIWDYLIKEGYLAEAYSKVEYSPKNHYIYKFTTDYAVEILPRDASDPLSSSRQSYFIVFHPYSFQRDALAIGNNPPTGWVAVRPRRGPEGGNYKYFNLFVFRPIGN